MVLSWEIKRISLAKFIERLIEVENTLEYMHLRRTTR